MVSVSRSRETVVTAVSAAFSVTVFPFRVSVRTELVPAGVQALIYSRQPVISRASGT